MERVRSAAKAVIVRDGRLLANHCRDATGEWYALPGGGQEAGESLEETIVRECREEIGVEVEVVGLRFVRDYIVARCDFSYLEEATHQVEHLFECRVPADYEAKPGPTPDRDQIGVAWLSPAQLAEVRIYPTRLRDVLSGDGLADLPTYWGAEE